MLSLLWQRPVHCKLKVIRRCVSGHICPTSNYKNNIVAEQSCLSNPPVMFCVVCLLPHLTTRCPSKTANNLDSQQLSLHWPANRPKYLWQLNIFNQTSSIHCKNTNKAACCHHILDVRILNVICEENNERLFCEKSISTEQLYFGQINVIFAYLIKGVKVVLIKSLAH